MPTALQMIDRIGTRVVPAANPAPSRREWDELRALIATQGREMLTEYERHLISISLDRYRHDIREACEEDQGTPEGRPGTLGHTMQTELRELAEKVRNLR